MLNNFFSVASRMRSVSAGLRSSSFFGDFPITNQPTELDKLAASIGHVAMKWNDIQFFIFAIFSTLLGDPVKARSVFFAIRTDRAQRDMTTALAVQALHNNDLCKKAVKLIDDVGRASGLRNEVLHGMWQTGHPDLFPKLFEPSGPRLSAKPDIKKELTDLLEALEELDTRAIFLHAEIQERLDALKVNPLAYLTTPAQLGPAPLGPFPEPSQQPEGPKASPMADDPPKKP